MRSVEENIEALSRAMMGEAKTEAGQILAQAKEKADSIQKQVEEQAKAQKAEILEKGRLEAERLRGQDVATTQMKARTMELENREKMLSLVFAAARKQISDIQERADYETIALRLVREAVLQLKAESLKIRVDQRTRKVLTDKALGDLSKTMKTKLGFGEPLEQGTGVVVETDDGHLQFDNTLETRLSRLENVLRPPVHRILIGEKL